MTTALKTLIEAETQERRVRSSQCQMRNARFPHHIHRRHVIDHAMGGTAGASITMFLLDDGRLFLCGVATSGFNTNPLGQTIAVPAPVIF